MCCFYPFSGIKNAIKNQCYHKKKKINAIKNLCYQKSISSLQTATVLDFWGSLLAVSQKRGIKCKHFIYKNSAMRKWYLQQQKQKLLLATQKL